MRKFVITVNGQQYDVEVEEVKNQRSQRPSVASATPSSSAPVQPVASKPAAAATNGSGTVIHAPMPGSILKINVKNGDAVKRGQSLLVLEAMKMENEITAPADGKIGSIQVSQGDCVTVGQTLVEII